MATKTETPKTRRDETVVEELHGHRIADPYRWLEDPDDPEVADWVRRQNEVTEAHLSSLPGRRWFLQTMRAVVHRPRAGVPLKRHGRYLLTRNDGRQNQDVWYVADSLDELRAGGRVLVDANQLSADGTTAVPEVSVSWDGARAVYCVSEGGSDWVTFRLVSLPGGDSEDDAEIQTKFSVPTWLPDSASYVYASFPHEGHAEGTDAGALPRPELRLHRIGSVQADDELVLSFPDDPQLLFDADASADGRWLVLTLARGTENRNRLWLLPVLDDGGRSRLGDPVRLVDEPVAEFTFLRTDQDVVYLATDLEAARGRVVRVDLAEFRRTGEVNLVEVVHEGSDTLQAAVSAGESFLLLTLRDAVPSLNRYSLDGTPLGTLPVRGGSVVGLSCEAGENEGFVGFSSVTTPTESYRFDAASGTVEKLDLVLGDDSGFRPPDVRSERRSATSADGTRVPFFLLSRADLGFDEPRPTLLYGYGGFKIPVLADYRPGWSGWLAAGGALAIANLRGGGEYGTDWYDAGRREMKQNVFDDFIAVAEELVASGVTTPAQLALHGRSNGGLLVGAVMTQRPDLAAVAVPAVGVLDLLRFHLFTIGRAWISDYGSPDDPDDFAVALGYSPLHRVREGAAYPATLVLTGDHDDRVVPLHSHKFTAALQHAQAADAPIVSRIEVSTGHGIGKPTSMVAAEWADLLAFVAYHTGLEVVEPCAS